MNTVTDRQKFLEAGYRLVSQSHDLESTISQLVQKAIQVSGSDMGSLYLLDPTKRVLRPFVTVNLPPEYVDGCKEVAVGSQCCGRAVLHRMPWFVQDMQTDPLFREARDAAHKAGVRAAFSVPVITERGECLGSLAAHFRQPHAPAPEVLQMVELCACVIAAALTRYNSGKPVDSAKKAPTPSMRSA